jgi:2-keto-4-pentenoate hydratase/2-oxohepta-3-ene-1,7-dioic acid hydratase in catechol pathway
MAYIVRPMDRDHISQVRLWVNGVLKQISTPATWPTDSRCIEWVNSIHVEPGDVLATGTNHGLSSFQDSDVVGLRVTNRSAAFPRDEPSAWGRETRLDMANKGQGNNHAAVTGKYATRS